MDLFCSMKGCKARAYTITNGSAICKNHLTKRKRLHWKSTHADELREEFPKR